MYEFCLEKWPTNEIKKILRFQHTFTPGSDNTEICVKVFVVWLKSLVEGPDMYDEVKCTKPNGHG